MPDEADHRDGRTRVAIVVADQASMFEVAAAIAVFNWCGPKLGMPDHDVMVCSVDGGVIGTTARVGLIAPQRLRSVRAADLVIVPTWPTPRDPIDPTVIRFLRRHHERGATVVGLCLGTFALAGAGLLDGRRATTHWSHVDLLSDLYPSIDVEHDRLWVDHGDVVTSAGSAAGLDCCLHLVRRMHGVAAANAVARTMVLAPQRSGGQAQFVPVPSVMAEKPDDVGRVLEWAVLHLDETPSIAELAARANVSRRTFERHVQSRHGVSPLQWLLQQRLVLARELLESTDLAIDDVARRAGLGSAVNLRTHFAAALGVSPSSYRAMYRSDTQVDLQSLIA
jgi:transcriptional regulator GlxA family with amidase domain